MEVDAIFCSTSTPGLFSEAILDSYSLVLFEAITA